MRKPVILFICFLLLQACSPFAKAAPSPTLKPTLTSMPTITPTVTSTPSITPSPTIVKIPTVDYNATATPPAYIFVLPTNASGPISVEMPTATPASPGKGFEWIKVSETEVYWGVCKPNKFRVTAQVSEPQDVLSVVTFIQLRRLSAQIFMPWNKGTGMEKTGGDGVWSAEISANAVDGHRMFRRGWIEYQVVATGVDGVEVGRSRIFMDTIKLQPCMCLTPPCEPGS